MSVHKLEAPTHAPLAPLCKPGTRDTLLDRLCEVAHAVPDAITASIVAIDSDVEAASTAIGRGSSPASWAIFLADA